MAAYEEALQELARVPPAEFVATRKRLVARLREQGAKDAAGELAKRRRPTSSVWVVNQLYWQRRAAFAGALEAAARLREGDLAATKAYRDALSDLRRHAARILKEAGLGATDATLRRAVATLGALAAAGGFDPDPPGALAEDRDPPGFEAVSLPAGDVPRAPRQERAAPAADRARERAREKREAHLHELERARLRRERERVERELGAATAERERREREVGRLEEDVRAARERLRAATERVGDLERERAKLDEG